MTVPVETTLAPTATAAPEPTPATSTETEPTFEQLPADHPLLRALHAERAAAKAAKAEAATLADKAKRLDAIEEASKSELEKAIARADAAEKARADAEVSAIRARIAAASGVPEGLLVGSDEAAIQASADTATTWLTTAKATTPGAAPATKQGSDATSAAPLGQVTEDQLASMTPEQINQARREGRLKTLLGTT
jgi:hypothetical protein